MASSFRAAFRREENRDPRVTESVIDGRRVIILSSRRTENDITATILTVAVETRHDEIEDLPRSFFDGPAWACHHMHHHRGDDVNSIVREYTDLLTPDMIRARPHATPAEGRARAGKIFPTAVKTLIAEFKKVCYT